MCSRHDSLHFTHPRNLPDNVRKGPILMNKDTLAKRMGLNTYDTALPQDWWDKCHAVSGENPIDYAIVWCYDDSLMGYPVALDARSAKYLSFVQQVRPA